VRDLDLNGRIKSRGIVETQGTNRNSSGFGYLVTGSKGWWDLAVDTARKIK
jgi:hypothetical protein